jgi:ketosteroid isomerase-like protein
MDTPLRQQLIEQYIQAYNNMDVEGMLATLHPDIVFQNISEGEINLSTQGMAAFRSQAEQAVQIFSKRTQTITGIHIDNNEAHVQISYSGTIARDLPNGWKAGDPIAMKGKSVFRFKDGQIISITDIS